MSGCLRKQVCMSLKRSTQSIPFGSASLYTKQEKAALNSSPHGPSAIPPRQGQSQLISPVSGLKAAACEDAAASDEGASGAAAFRSSFFDASADVTLVTAVAVASAAEVTAVRKQRKRRNKTVSIRILGPRDSSPWRWQLPVEAIALSTTTWRARIHVSNLRLPRVCGRNGSEVERSPSSMAWVAACFFSPWPPTMRIAAVHPNKAARPSEA